MTALEHITGADRLVERFGGWPSFHDAEVVRLTLDRRGENGPTAEMLVHAWLMTDKVDERGYYVLEKHTLVRFVFERLASCEVSDFNHQNVLFGLEVSPETVEGEAAFRVTLDSSFGLGGSLLCGRVVVADVAPCDDHGHRRATDNPPLHWTSGRGTPTVIRMVVGAAAASERLYVIQRRVRAPRHVRQRSGPPYPAHRRTRGWPIVSAKSTAIRHRARQVRVSLAATRTTEHSTS